MAAAKTFRGGIHPQYSKESTAGQPIRAAAPPPQVVIPLCQHIGAPCEPLVAKGDRVLLGQKIGDSSAFVSAPVHASVSGTVAAVENRPHPSLGSSLAVVIDNDGQDELDPSLSGAGARDAVSVEDIRRAVRAAGVVGLGGAAFPTAVKITPPQGKPIEVVVLNGAECEPYLTADHRLMLEETQETLDGLGLIVKACGAKRGLIAIEDNKPDAVEAISQALAAGKGPAGVEVQIVLLHTKYPQGSEKQLVWACLNREVPSGGLPLDVGVVVSNVGTAGAVARAVAHGTPLYERVVTVTGSPVAQPQNLRVRLGTSFAELIEQCGGFVKPVAKVINGGPMMGIALPGLDFPVVKGTSGLLCLGQDEAGVDVVGPCLKCGRCVENCPMFLAPLWIAAYGERGLHEQAERLGALDCMECGSCAYICPARRPLVQAIRHSKGEILARRRREARRSAPAG